MNDLSFSEPAINLPFSGNYEHTVPYGIPANLPRSFDLSSAGNYINGGSHMASNSNSMSSDFTNELNILDPAPLFELSPAENHAFGGSYMTPNTLHHGFNLSPVSGGSYTAPVDLDVAETLLPMTNTPPVAKTTQAQPYPEIGKFMKNIKKYTKFYLAHSGASRGPIAYKNGVPNHGVLFHFEQASFSKEELVYDSFAGSRVTLIRADGMALDTPGYRCNLAPYITTEDRLAYFGSFDYFGLPPELKVGLTTPALSPLDCTRVFKHSPHLNIDIDKFLAIGAFQIAGNLSISISY